MSAGKKLRELRKKANKTLQESADIFGVKLNAVYRWEHDQASPDGEMLKKIADFYGAPPDWLQRDDEDEGSAECGNGAQNSLCATEQRIMKILKKLPENCKHRILGYVEHIYMEMQENQ
jgi:transcriptional regulator with XRE-family HTH domain